MLIVINFVHITFYTILWCYIHTFLTGIIVTVLHWYRSFILVAMATISHCLWGVHLAPVWPHGLSGVCGILLFPGIAGLFIRKKYVTVRHSLSKYGQLDRWYDRPSVCCRQQSADQWGQTSWWQNSEHVPWRNKIKPPLSVTTSPTSPTRTSYPVPFTWLASHVSGLHKTTARRQCMLWTRLTVSERCVLPLLYSVSPSGERNFHRVHLRCCCWAVLNG